MELILENIVKKYGDNLVLDRLSYSFTPGIYGLLGANGAGKTTLLTLLAGAAQPDEGNIFWNKLRIDHDLAGYYSNLGFLPQSFNYYSSFTGLEFLVYLAILKGVNQREAKKQGEKLLASVSLLDAKNKKIGSYSGGMKQRVGIAQALINDPKILILDEPTVGLDPQERVNFRNLISRLSNNRIIVLSTHIVSDVEDIADKILILKDGQFQEQGTPQELLATLFNKVWELTVTGNNRFESNNNYQVINSRITAKGTIKRIVSEKDPGFGAVQVEPRLEDIYLVHFNSGANK